MIKAIRHHLQKTEARIVLALAVILTCAAFFTVMSLRGAREELLFSEPETAAPMEGVLDRGIYTVSVHYHMKDYGKIRLLLSDMGGGARSREQIIFLAGEHQTAEARIYVGNNNTWISAEWTEGNGADNHLFSVRVTYRGKLSLSYLLLCLLISYLLCFLLYRLIAICKMKDNPETLPAVVILLLTVLLCCIPLYARGIPYGHDVGIHLKRLAGIAEGMTEGYFPVRIQNNWWQDLGYPFGVMYPDSLLYPFALCYLLGMPLMNALRLYLVVVHVLTTVVSFWCFRVMSGRNLSGAAGSMLYTLSMWRLTDCYTRAALGEYTAMLFLPLVIAGFFVLFREDAGEKKVYGRSVLLLAGGFTGLLQSHLLTTAMTGFFSVLLCICFIGRLLKNRAKRLRALLTAAGMTVLMNLGSLVPLSDYMSRYSFTVSESHVLTTGLGHETSVRDWLSTAYDVTATSATVSEGNIPEMPLTPGYGILLMIVPLLLFLLVRAGHAGKKETAVYFALGLLSLLMTTRFFPYAWLSDHIPVLYRLLGAVQYQFRYLTTATLFFCAAWMCVLQNGSLPDESKGMFSCRVLPVLSVLLMAVTFLQGVAYVLAYWLYLFDDVVLSGALAEKAPLSSSADMTVEWPERSGLKDVLQIENGSVETQSVEIPRWHYAYYEAKDGQGNSLSLTDGTARRILVAIPAGFRDSVTVDFHEPWHWRLAECLSLAGFVLFLGMIRLHGMRKKYYRRCSSKA